ncbi:MAG: NB-ARC domain-containing protein [Caldilineaceae bacterium]
MSAPIPVPRFGDSLAIFVADLRSWVFPSQVKAAQYFNLTHSTISRYENNRLTPQIGYIAHLAHLFVEQNHAADPQETGDAELARARQTLLNEVNQVIRWCYPGEKPLQSWDELSAVSAAYRTDPAGARPPAPPAPALLAHTRADWDAAPDVSTFYGRQQELKTLTQWVLDHHCRLVSVLGMGGIGKTALVTHLAEQLVGQFDRLIWRTLRNGPLIHELLDALVGLVTDQPVDLANATLDQKIAVLLDGLRTHRCLLVLDNWETLLGAGGESGHFRTGYEAYEYFLRAVGETRHQSCLLMTSRENPALVGLFQGQSNAVQTLRLRGLDAEETRQILADKGLSGPARVWDELNQRYSGNPLALKFAAETIQETFVGDIEQFLNADVAVVGEVRRVLDQQFARLTALERDIIFWLTVTLEPTTLADLQRLMIQPPPVVELVDALQSLRRRSLIDQSSRGFALQNVLLEYSAARLIDQVCDEVVGDSSPLLQSHALILAQAKEYVRNSQTRLILQPIGERLQSQWLEAQLQAYFKKLLDKLRQSPDALRGYAGGNLLNLLLHLGMSARGYDFSHLAVWEAYLRNAALPAVNFQRADLSGSVFTDAFVGINAVALSPDGALLAVATESEVHVWKVASGQLFAVFQGHTDLVWAVAFSPDGRMLASGSADQSVRVWDLETLHYRQIMEDHINWVWSVVFAPDGATLFSGSEDGTVRQWDLISGQCRHVFHRATAAVFAVAVDSTGELLAVGGDNGMIEIWHIATLARVRTLTVPTAIGPHKNVGAEILTLAFSPNGALLASGGNDGAVYLWDAQTGRLVQVLKGHTQRISCLSFTPDGALIVSGSYDETIRLWDVRSGQLRHLLHKHSQAVRSLAISRDGQTLVSGSYDQTIRIWNLPGGQMLNTLHGYTQEVRAMALSPDGRTLASGGADQTVRIWDVVAGQLRHTGHAHRRWVQALAFSPNGEFLASGSYDRTVRIWDAATGQLLRTLEGPARWVWSVAYSPDGALLAAGSADGIITLWDTRTWQILHRFEGHTRGVWSIAFDASGALLASAGEDGTVQLWDVPARQSRQTLHGDGDAIYHVVFAATGKSIFSADEKGHLDIWDVDTGVRRTALHPTSRAITALAYSSPGSWLAIGAGDGTIYVLDVATGEIIRTLTSHGKAVSSLVFGMESALLISGSYDETIRFWHVESGQQIKLLRVERPYEGMNISNATGLTRAQRATLQNLGAIES